MSMAVERHRGMVDEPLRSHLGSEEVRRFLGVEQGDDARSGTGRRSRSRRATSRVTATAAALSSAPGLGCMQAS